MEETCFGYTSVCASGVSLEMLCLLIEILWLKEQVL
jgi:hypothetical protein